MQSSRLIPAILILSAASLWAQLPPSALRPASQPPAPVAPLTRHSGNTAPAAPAVPGTPGRVGNPVKASPVLATPTAPVPMEEEQPEETPSAPPVIDTTNTVPNTLTPEETAQGWQLLFDGKRLIGMRGVQRNDPLSAGWKIQDGELTLPKEIRDMDKLTGGDLMTTQVYWDFEFRFDWKATVSANSGIRYLVNTAIGQPPTGLEYQIIDDVHASIGLKGGPLRRTGALDNVLPVGANARLRSADPANKKGDPWNEGRIVVQGQKVEHWLNGDKVLEFQLGPHLRTAAERNYKRDELFASRPHAFFGTKARTPIVIMDQGTEVAFRNLKVRPLVPQAVAPAAAPGAAGIGQRAPVPSPFLIPPKAATSPQR